MKHSVDWCCDLCGYDSNPQEVESCDMCGLMPTDDMPISEFLSQQGIQNKE
jgi:hypothetical protein